MFRDPVENWAAEGTHIVTGVIKNDLEPHDDTKTDDLAKAKDSAENVRQNPGIGRQLIWLLSGPIKRLDVPHSAVHGHVSRAMTNDEFTTFLMRMDFLQKAGEAECTMRTSFPG